MKKLLLSILVITFLSGCSVKNPQVPVVNLLSSYQQNDVAIGLIDEYVRTNNTFSQSDALRASKAQAALSGMIERLDRRIVNGSVDYFYIKYFFEDVGDEFAELKSLLDIQFENADNPYAKQLYYMTKAQIELLLRQGNILISQADEDINAANIQELEQYITSLITQISPYLSL